MGWLITGIGRIADPLNTPSGELKNTGYGSFNGEAALGWHGDWGSLALRVNQYGGEFKLLEANGPPPGLEGIDEGPERKTADQRVQITGKRCQVVEPVAGKIRIAETPQVRDDHLESRSCERLDVPPPDPLRLRPSVKQEQREPALALADVGHLDPVADPRAVNLKRHEPNVTCANRFLRPEND